MRAPSALELEDKWILSKLNTVIPEVTENMDKYELGVAAQKVYDFIWDSYCDWYIELSKSRLQGGTRRPRSRPSRSCAMSSPRCSSSSTPFMPFITEEIWQALPHEGEYLILQKWPEYRAELGFPEEERAMELVMEAIAAVRTGGRR